MSTVQLYRNPVNSEWQIIGFLKTNHGRRQILMVWSWHVLGRESKIRCIRILGLLLRHISCEQEYSGQLIFS
jgi:hypothetical protein